MIDKIKKYDKMLFLEKRLDWSIELKRKSQFYKTTNFNVFTITNQYLWSCRWIISKLIKMDSRRLDLISAWMVRHKKLKQDTRLSEEVARFIQEWNKIVL